MSLSNYSILYYNMRGKDSEAAKRDQSNFRKRFYNLFVCLFFLKNETTEIETTDIEAIVL